MNQNFYQPSKQEMEKVFTKVMYVLEFRVEDDRDREEIANDVLFKAMKTYDPSKGASFTTWAGKLIVTTAADYYDCRKRQTRVKNASELLPAIPDEDAPESPHLATTCRAHSAMEFKCFEEHLIAGLRKHKKGPLLMDFLLYKMQGFETGEIADKLGLSADEGNNLRDVFVYQLKPLVEQYLSMTVDEYLGIKTAKK